MIVWLDAQLPPALVTWFRSVAKIEAMAIRDLGLRASPDADIFAAARKPSHVIISKDVDFVELVTRLGPPPQIVWLTCGNLTTSALVRLMERGWKDIERLLKSGEPVVELE